MAKIGRGGHVFDGYNKPIRTPGHSSGKSHAVVIKDNGKDRLIRFGQQGAKTAGKPKPGESEAMKKKRAAFKSDTPKTSPKAKPVLLTGQIA